MNEKGRIILKRGVGDRILLGCLSITMIVVFGVMAVWFIQDDQKTLISTLGFEFSFVASFISGLGLLWAIATPKFIENLIAQQTMKVLLTAMLVLLGAIIMFLYPILHNA